MTLLELIRDVASRIAWIREECDPHERERALEDLELDVAGWLDRYDEEGRFA